MPCIFCGTNDNLTDEHVFPAFLGGELVVRDGSCRACNGRIGTFEQVFARETQTARQIFEIADRYGEIRDAPVQVRLEGEPGLGAINLRRRADGEIELRDFVSEFRAEDGRNVRHGFFTTNEAAQRFIERARARGQQVDELALPRDIVLLPESRQTLAFTFLPDVRRVIAKIALAAIAYHYGVDYACQPSFDCLRRSIFGPVENLIVRVFANGDFAAAHVRTPQRHSVNGYLSAGMHKGWAIVSLFGGLSYIVRLTDNFQEDRSRQFSVYYDAATRRQFVPVVRFDEMTLIGRVLSTASQFESPRALDAQMYPIVSTYCDSKGIQVSRLEE